jgi:alkylation response protein AidB-like acyl-CoA dehydrogenase
MDLSFGSEYEQLRRDVEAFCKSSWPAAGANERERGIAWRRLALAAGYLHRTVPKQYGGGGLQPDILAETVIRRAFEAAGVPYRASAQGTHMLVPTLLECGTEAQRQAYIAKTLTGELNWCQGYSEPGSGSDLASLKSTALLDGEQWVIQRPEDLDEQCHRRRHDVRPVPHRAGRPEARRNLVPARRHEDARHRRAPAAHDAGR